MRENEAQLRDKAEQLAQVMLSAPEGVLLLDNLNHVLLANKRGSRSWHGWRLMTQTSGWCSWVA